jgi:hypothetical protein
LEVDVPVKKSAKVHDLTAERGRRGKLPWAFTVDLAASHFRATLFRGATSHDLIAMAEACEKWSTALRAAAKSLRASLSHRVERVER